MAPNPSAGASSADLASPFSIAGLTAWVVRVGGDGRVTYANSSLCRSLGVPRAKLIGQPVEDLRGYGFHLLSEAVTQTLQATSTGATYETQDEQGHRFRVRYARQGSGWDIVIEDISETERLRAVVEKYVNRDLAHLTAEELESFRFPERRFMTVMFCDLRGFTALGERLSPEDVRSALNDYFEAVIPPIEANGGAVDKIVADEVMGLFGAPRYHPDHALRAVKTACEQMARLEAVQVQYQRMGRELPDCGIGINTGDMLVGNVGTTTRLNYTVLGSSVNLASRLCAAAEGGEVLVTQETVQSILENLPPGWEAVESNTDFEVDLAVLEARMGKIEPLPEHFRNRMVSIGPGVASRYEAAEFHFAYICLFQPKGFDHELPIMAAWPARPDTDGVSFSLSEGAGMASQAEKIFGRYRLVELVGRGGMGEVWRARDNFGNTVAVKMLRSGETASESQLRRFRREAEIMARLSHRNICRIHEVGQAEGVPYIAMEYIEGVSLHDLLAEAGKLAGDGTSPSDPHNLPALIEAVRQRLAREASSMGVEGVRIDEDDGHPADGYLVLPLAQIISVLLRIADAVQFAHEHGVLHRDLKPANIMMRPDGDPVVMDFGLAKLERGEVSRSLSLSGEVIGTFEYMAPEQALASKTIDERADVYALGTILYLMVTGRRHFITTGNLAADLQRLMAFEPVPPRQVNAALDRDIEIITLRSLNPEPEHRYRTVAALRADLERYQRGELISAKEATVREVAGRWYRRNRPVALTILTAAGLLIIGALVSLTMLISQFRAAVRARELAELRREEAEDARRKAEENEQLALAAQHQAELAQRAAEDALNKARAAEEGRSHAESVAARTRAEQLERAADDALAAGRLQEGEKLLGEALGRDPLLASAWFRRGQVRLARTRFAEARGDLAEAAKLDPARYADAYRTRNEMLTRYETLETDKGRLANTDRLALLRELQSYPEYDLYVQAQTEFQRELLKALRGVLAALNPQAGVSEANVRLVDGTLGLRLEIADMPALTKLPPLAPYGIFQELALRGVGVTDLAVLQDVPARRLDLINTPARDLAPLADLSLTEFVIQSAEPVDLAPLAQAKLQRLETHGFAPPLGMVAEARALRHLAITNCRFANLAALRKLRLSSLNLARTDVKDLAPLASMITLRTLDLTGTPVSNIQALRHLPLETLALSGTRVNQLDPLAHKPTLRVLRVKGCQLIDLDRVAATLRLDQLEK